MKINCDFHLHSCLSPCADEDMTPANIVSMATLCGLGAVALTDHNTVKNCRAAIECGRRAGLLVLAGMELTTAEEAHVIFLFPDLDSAESFEKYVDQKRIRVKNNVEIFGRQLVLDADEKVLEEYENLLTVATEIGVFETASLAKEYGGIAYPAHIDRPAFSVVSSLGFVTEDMGYGLVEFSARGFKEGAPEKLSGLYPKELPVISCSDAHYLEHMSEAAFSLETNRMSAAGLIEALYEGKIIL